ncbi:MAG: hypothetical protein QME81_20135, partial [bacterium]|nr:hypothetical protein [bacterium]
MLPKSRMRENLKSGSVRDIKQTSMVEYCDTLHIEREEKQGIQSIPNEGGYTITPQHLRCPRECYDC